LNEEKPHLKRTWLGAVAQSNGDRPPAEEPPVSDRTTGERLGRHLALITRRPGDGTPYGVEPAQGRENRFFPPPLAEEGFNPG
jgi:hypothetical protein